MRVDQVISLVFRSVRCETVSVMSVRRPFCAAAEVSWRRTPDGDLAEFRSRYRVPDVPGLAAGLADHPLFLPVLEPTTIADGLMTMTTQRSAELATCVRLQATGSFDELDCALAALLLPLLPLLSDLASARPGDLTGPARPPALTARQADILGHLRDGLTAEAIGRRCGITMRTVNKHLEQIYRRLGCHDKVSAVLAAERAGLLRPQPAPVPRTPQLSLPDSA